MFSKFIKQLPYERLFDDHTLDVALWENENNVCEYADGEHGFCDTSGYYYGTNDPREPQFCARHFYQIAVDEERTGYKLISRDDSLE